MLHRSVSIIMLRIDYRMPLGLMIQPAAQIVRELPPRPKSYCVTLFFHAGRYLPLSNVWSTVVVGMRGGYNEKSRLQLRPVGTLSKSTTRLLDKAERMCKRP